MVGVVDGVSNCGQAKRAHLGNVGLCLQRMHCPTCPNVPGGWQGVGQFVYDMMLCAHGAQCIILYTSARSLMAASFHIKR